MATLNLNEKSDYEEFVGLCEEIKKLREQLSKYDPSFQKQLEAQEKIKNEMLDLALTTEQDRINIMDEGSKKRLEQIDHNFNKEIAALEKKISEWKSVQGGVLTVDQTKKYDDAYLEIFNKRIKEEAASNKTEEDAANAKKKVNDFLTDILADTSKTTKKRVGEVISDIKQLLDYIKGVDGVKIPAGVTEDGIKKLKENPKELVAIYDALIKKQQDFDSRNNYPFSGLINGFKRLRDVSKLYEEAISQADGEQKKFLENKAQEAKFQGLKSIYEGAEAALKSVNELITQIELLANATGSSEMKEFATEMKKTTGMISDVVAGAKAGSAGGPIGALIGGAVGLATNIYKDVLSDVAAKKELEKSILAFQIKYNSLLLERNYLEKEFSSYFGTRKIEQMAGAYKSAQESLGKYSEALNRSLTGDTEDNGHLEKDFLNPLNIVTKSMDKLVDKIFPAWVGEFGDGVAKFISKAAPLLGWLGIGGKRSNKGDVLQDAMNRGMNELQGMLIKVKDRKWYKLGSRDTYTTLFDMAPQLWGNDINGEFDTAAAQAFLDTNKKITDEQRLQIGQIIEYKDQYDKAMGEIDTHLSNTYSSIASSLAGGIFDAVRNGADAWGIFEKTGLSVIDSLGKELLQEIIMGEYLEQFRPQMRDAFKLGDPKAIQEELMSVTTDLFNGLPMMIDIWSDAARMWDQRASDMGWDMSKLVSEAESPSASDNTLKGAYAKASQESIDLLAGQTGAARVALEDIRRMMAEDSSPDKNEYYMSFQHGLNSIIEIQRSGWNEVAVIRELSRQVVNNTEAITQISQSIANSNNDIATGVNNTAKDLNIIVNSGVKLKGTGLGS
ncbi:MAG: hypothetical protein LBV74_02445 [Tannerella sp.]|jgi:hypothetical protein|nr:hypothetical protein [Tannerella sp.]